VTARTGEDYLKGLRATRREVWLGDERVEDVSEHPLLRGGAEAIAAYYDLQHEHADTMLTADPVTGEQMSVSHIQPRSVADLRRRGVALTKAAELSMGVMGRTPDYLNVTFAGFADDAARWAGVDGSNAQGFENLVEFQKRLRRDDLSLTHTIVHPTIDKETDDRFDADSVRLHKVGETAESIIVRGGRLLATLAPFADEQTVYPSKPLPKDGSPAFALSFTVPMDAPGLAFVCRDSGLRPDVDPLDAPFSTRYDELDAYCIFDDVEIPKRDVWIDGNIEVYNAVMGSTWWPNIMQQTTTRALVKLEFAYGLAVRMADVVNDVSERTQEQLGEIVNFIEVTRSCLELSVANAATWEGGGVYPEARALHPLRSLLPTWFVRVNEIIRSLGSHNMLCVGSQGQFRDPRMGPLLEEFLRGANGITAAERSLIYRLAWDFVGSTLGSRNELYERNYLMTARSNRVMMHKVFAKANKARGSELVGKFLDAASARSDTR
jgi:4-hydroxyphenylacetate 3-monooxygenase